MMVSAHAQAVKNAATRARRRGEDVYVVYESGQYDTATEEELDTFYAGIAAANILERVSADGRVS